jgi:reprolysin-like metallo-peptidase family M12B
MTTACKVIGPRAIRWAAAAAIAALGCEGPSVRRGAADGPTSLPGRDASAVAAPDARPDESTVADGLVPADAAPDMRTGTVAVTLVEVAQAVFIKVGDGQVVVPPAMRNSKLIEGRAAFLRVHLRPDASFSPRRLRAVLTLEQADGSQQALEDSKMISEPSSTEKLDSSFNFLLAAEAIKPGATIVAAIHEEGGLDPAGRFPATGTADLGVQAGPMLMDVVLVPVSGPSGPLDDSPARRKHLEAYLADVYPAQKMTIRWHDPLPITSVINSSTAFRMLATARRQDGASPGSYYHMLIAVEDSMDKFLGLGVDAGPLPSDAASRIAMTMVTEHQVDSQMDTVSHEMGHNLGRNHAPGCNAGGVDDAFPYPNTGVGVDGYSVGEMAAGRDHLPNAPGPFKSKTKFKDVMGYCYPTWISDYTWNGFAARIRIVTEFSGPQAMLALEERSLQGFYAPGRAPEWAVVAGALVPPGAAVDARRFARIRRRDGSRATVPITLALMRSPAGPEDRARTIAINLPDDEVASIEVFVDGERFTVSGEGWR